MRNIRCQSFTHVLKGWPEKRVRGEAYDSFVDKSVHFLPLDEFAFHILPFPDLSSSYANITRTVFFTLRISELRTHTASWAATARPMLFSTTTCMLLSSMVAITS